MKITYTDKEVMKLHGTHMAEQLHLSGTFTIVVEYRVRENSMYEIEVELIEDAEQEDQDVDGRRRA